MNTEEKYVWLTTAPIPGLVGRLAVPTILSMLITSIYNMADTYFVGELGTSAQGAVSVVLPLMNVIQAIGFTFGNGAGNYVSRLLGQQDRDRAEVVAATGFFAGVLAGTALMLLGEIFLDPLVRLLGATETILPYARSYARFILIGAPYMMGTFVLNNLLRFEGSATLSMIGIMVGGVLNIILDPLFIFGLHLDVAGAALATILSQLVSFVILLTIKLRGKTIPIRWSRVQWSHGPLGTIVLSGLPSMYRQGLASAATILLNWAAKPLGDAAIAAMGIVSKVSMFSNAANVGFGQGFQPVCGFNYGAKLYHRVREAFWFCVRVGTLVLIGIAAVLYLLSPQIVYAFQKNDPEVLRMGTLAMRCAMCSLPLMAFVVLVGMMLQATGEHFPASLMAAARQGIFFIPTILVLPRLFGFTGIMLAQPIADACAFLLGVPLTISFLRKMRRLEQQNSSQKAAVQQTTEDGADRK